MAAGDGVAAAVVLSPCIGALQHRFGRDGLAVFRADFGLGRQVGCLGCQFGRLANLAVLGPYIGDLGRQISLLRRQVVRCRRSNNHLEATRAIFTKHWPCAAKSTPGRGRLALIKWDAIEKKYF